MDTRIPASASYEGRYPGIAPMDAARCIAHGSYGAGGCAYPTAAVCNPRACGCCCGCCCCGGEKGTHATACGAPGIVCCGGCWRPLGQTADLHCPRMYLKQTSCCADGEFLRVRPTADLSRASALERAATPSAMALSFASICFMKRISVEDGPCRKVHEESAQAVPDGVASKQRARA